MSKIEKKNILVIPGDGAGKEMMKSALFILDWLNDNNIISVNIESENAGIEFATKSGTNLKQETISKLQDSDAIILGKFGEASNPKKEEDTLGIVGSILSNFKAMSVTYPVKTYEGLNYLNKLKNEELLNFSLIRDIDAGLYKGEPRGIKEYDKTSTIGINTLSYNAAQVYKFMSYIEFLPNEISKNILSIDRIDLLETFILWRHVFNERMSVFQEKGKTLHFGILDDFYSIIYNNPKSLGTVITPNHVGDNIIQNLIHLFGLSLTIPVMYTSMLDLGKYRYMFSPLMVLNDVEVLDGNSPISLIESVSQILAYVFNRKDLSDMVHSSVEKTLLDGYRTKDIMPNIDNEYTEVSSIEFGEIVLSEFIKIYNK